MDDAEWEDREEGVEGSSRKTFHLALSRNNQLQKETRKASLEMLPVARVVFLGSSALPPSSPVLEEPLLRFLLLELPAKLLQVVLLFVHPGALSTRQWFSVVRYATDRTTLLPKRTEPEAYMRIRLRQRVPVQNPLDLETRYRYRFSREFLEDTGCDRYD